MPEFSSGAIRSNDAEKEAWYLISPIAWRRLASAYSQIKGRFARKDLCLNETIRHINEYLSGKRDIDYLAYSLFYLCEALQIEETNRPTSEGLFSVYSYRYDLISPVGLRRIAERYRIGEKKYGAYNCEQGFPIHDLLNHGIRHIKMHIAGWEDEPGDDNLGGVAWGLCMAMHSEELWPEMNRGHLRGPNCSITDDIKAKIKEFQASKEVTNPKSQEPITDENESENKLNMAYQLYLKDNRHLLLKDSFHPSQIMSYEQFKIQYNSSTIDHSLSRDENILMEGNN